MAINDSGHVFVGTSGGGVFRSKDYAASWQPASVGLPANVDVRSFCIDKLGRIFAGTVSQGIFRSDNNGASWVPVNNGLANLSITTSLLMKRDTLFASFLRGGVFRSDNYGASWVPVNNGLVNNDVRALVCDMNGSVFASTAGSGVFCSTNNGANWMLDIDGLGDLDIRTGLYATGDTIFCGGYFSGDVYMQIARGKWKLLGKPGRGATSVSAIFLDKQYLFGGTLGAGVGYLIDLSGEWRPTDGLMNERVRAIKKYKTGFMYAATDDNGVYRLDLARTRVDEHKAEAGSQEYVLAQNYPNPFNPSTMIKFELAKASFTTLKVFDLTGREIAILIARDLPAGRYEVMWAPSHKEPSGIYFYRLKAANYLQTRKMVFQK